MCQNSFSLSSRSFNNISNDKETIYKNIEKLSNVNEKIKSFEDLLFKEDAIFTTILIDNKQLYEIMFSDHADFQQDYKTMLNEIVGKAKNSNGVEYQKVGLNQIEEKNIIYTTIELMEYYYEHIKHVHNETDFFNCIKKYFQNLEFQNNIGASLGALNGGGLQYFAEDIVKSLICLNDEFKTILADNHNDVRKSLVKLASTIGLEATIEGDAARKPIFVYEFIKDDGTSTEVCCEPHIKLCRSSKSGDNTFYFNRLHFHVGLKDIKHGRILIGHIGCHL
jgi:hypothetical protein